MIKAIIRALWQQGFRCIFIVSIHGPNGIPIGNAVRTVFEEDNIPAVYLSPWKYLDGDELRQKIPNYDGAYKEAMLAYAGAKILGKEHAIPDLSALKDAEVPEGSEQPAPLRKVQKCGSVGYHYTHELQHIPPRAGIDVELGVRILEDAAEKMLPAVDALREYVKWLEENPRRFIAE